MTELTIFLSASALLLAAPGPTNTLLCVSGALVGVRRSCPLLLAEILAYGLSIAVLVFLAGPWVQHVPMVSVALRLGSALYLSWAAFGLWRDSHRMIEAGQQIDPRRVFVATLLNPKGLVMAFGLLPAWVGEAPGQGVGHFMGLGLVMGVVGLGWIAFGAMIGQSTKVNSALLGKIGAATLACFAVALTVSLVR